jgi:lysophospholipase L1-like esterase
MLRPGWFIVAMLLIVAGTMPARADLPPRHRFGDEILAYERADQKLPPLPGGVLMIGADTFRLWPQAPRDLSPYPVLNRAFGGSTNGDVLHFFDRIVAPYEPRVILYHEGANAIAAGKTPQAIAEDFAAVVERVKNQLPETRMVVLSITPTPETRDRWPQMQQANALIRKQAKLNEKLYYVDVSAPLLTPEGAINLAAFAEDGATLTTETRHTWAQCIQPTLADAWQQAGGPDLTFNRELKDGEKIVFIGDSLTTQTLPGDGYVYSLMDKLRRARPDLLLQFERAGIAMTTSVDWDRRLLDRQALRHEPTLAVVYLGTADMIGFFGNRSGGTSQDAFKTHMTSLVKRIRQAGSDLILITPALLGEAPDPHRKGMRYTRVYADIVRTVACEQDVPLVDLHWRFHEHLRAHKDNDKPSGLVTTDGVHFNEAGQAIVVQEIMTCLGVDMPASRDAASE